MAAAGWSLLLSPLFGAILLDRNWQALGEKEATRWTRLLMWGSTIALGYGFGSAFIYMSKPAEKTVTGIGKIVGLLLTSACFSIGRAQKRFLKDSGKLGYPRGRTASMGYPGSCFDDPGSLKWALNHLRKHQMTHSAKFLQTAPASPFCHLRISRRRGITGPFTIRHPDDQQTNASSAHGDISSRSLWMQRIQGQNSKAILTKPAGEPTPFLDGTCACVAAALVGFFLEQHQESLGVLDFTLEAIEGLRPRGRHDLDRNAGGRLTKRWNVIVPGSILERRWEEPTVDESSSKPLTL